MITRKREGKGIIRGVCLRRDQRWEGGGAHTEQQPKILNSSWQMTRFKLDVKLPDFHPQKKAFVVVIEETDLRPIFC